MPLKREKPKCLRCPTAQDGMNAQRHGNTLSKCFKDLPPDDLTPYTLSDLWPTFDEGDKPADLDLSDQQVCKDLIEAARNKGSTATFKDHKINKSMLEAAASKAYPAIAAAGKKKPKPKAAPPPTPAPAAAPPTPAMDSMNLNSRPAATSMSPAAPPMAAPARASAHAPPPAPAAPSGPAVGTTPAPQAASGAVGSATAAPFVPVNTSNLTQTTTTPSTVPTVASSATNVAAGTTSAPPVMISTINQVNNLADRIYQTGLQTGAIQISTAAGAQPVDTQKQNEVQKIARGTGLRTAYAQDGNATRIVTNHLALTPPNNIYVYSLEMIREFDQHGQPVFAKKQWDRLRVIEELIGQNAQPWQANLAPQMHQQQTITPWVTDGDLIWSILPLFRLTQPGQTLAPMAPVPAIQYRNELGELLDIEQISVTYDRVIPISATPIGDLFYDNNAPSFDDSVPGILTRGLNAFLSSHARRSAVQGNVTLAGINKSFRNIVVDHLDQPQNGQNMQTVNVMQGYFLSVRPGVDNYFININHATSPFFEPILVSEFIRRAARRGPSEIDTILRGVKVRIEYQTNAGWPAGLPAARERFIESVGPNRIDAQAPHTRYPNVASVYDWYDLQNSPYSGLAEFPSPNTQAGPIRPSRACLAVNTGKDPVRFPNHEEWIPADQLRILPFQPFKGRLTGKQTSGMIDNARHEVRDHQQALLRQGNNGLGISGGLLHFGFVGHSATQLRHDIGMIPGTQFVQIDARWLAPPAVRYLEPRGPRREKQADVQHAKWDLRDKAFASTPNKMNQVLILELGDAQFLQQLPLPPNFSAILLRQLHAHGLTTQQNIPVVMKQANPVTPLSSAWEATFEQGMLQFPAVQNHIAQQQRNNIPSFQPRNGPTVLVIMQEQSYDDYACIKRVGDLKLGINTICVRRDGLLRGGGWNPQKASNIALKFNMKASGDTHHLASPHLSTLRNASGAVNTIVLGADVAHPTKGCYTGTPSVSAVVGTIDDEFMQYRGSMRLQRGRQEKIAYLQDMVYERVLAWADEHNQQLPTNILFYRDGVSESQYEMVRTLEIPQIQNAMNLAHRRLHANSTAPPPLPFPQVPPSNDKKTRVKNETKAYRQWADQMQAQAGNVLFNMTFVVVGKRHNTRFYPAPGGPVIAQATRGPRSTRGNYNCPPGLAVDRVITHSTSMDFYLQSHEPIIGTGRPAHYFVIQNNMDLSIDQVQGITHTFCYAYARATRGVSYCAPAYYADKLCDRGRAYIRHLLISSDQITTGYNLTTNGRWPYRRQNQPAQTPAETHEAYVDNLTQVVATGQSYFRGWRARNRPDHVQYGMVRMNPFHRNLDNGMFWL